MYKPYFDMTKPEMKTGHREVLLRTDYESAITLKVSDFPAGTEAIELYPYNAFDEDDHNAAIEVTFIRYRPYSPEEKVKLEERLTVELHVYEKWHSAYQLELAEYEKWLQGEQDKQEREQYEELKKKFES